MIKTYTITRIDLKHGKGAKACSLRKEGQAPTVREYFHLIEVLKKMLNQ